MTRITTLRNICRNTLQSVIVTITLALAAFVLISPFIALIQLW